MKILEHFRAKWEPVRVKEMRPNNSLEHFRAKWEPVRVKEMRPNKNLEPVRDSVKVGTALSRIRLISATASVAYAVAASAAIAGPLEVTNTNDSGAGSLRDAMEYANDNSTEDAITFNIPGAGPHIITLSDKLPVINDAGVSIDGTTQSGASCGQLTASSQHTLKIQIDGNQQDTGFEIDAANVTLRGIAIVDFQFYGVRVKNNGDNMTVECLHVGVETNGFTGNSVSIGKTPAVFVEEADNIALQNSLISGNDTEVNANGVWLQKANGVVQGNIIGLTASGIVALPNGGAGVHVKGSSLGMTIGGTTAATRNVISGNDAEGLYFESDVVGVTVLGNYIGLGVNGSSALGNGSDGVFVKKDGYAGIISNRIAYNGGLGIDLGDTDGVTKNDFGDGDDGGNDGQNFPVLNEIGAKGSTQTWYDFNLDTLSNASGYRIEFFKNSAADPSGNGEGEIYLGAINVSHSGGDTQFTGSFVGLATVSVGDLISATATRKTAFASYDATSEFAATVTSVAAPSAELAAAMSVTPLISGDFAIPGYDVIYTIDVANEGLGPSDTDSVVLIDEVPAELIFFNGDHDGPGPSSDRVGFTETSTTLTFDPVADVKFSDAGSQPANLAACTYSPAVGYDPLVTYICINPKGAMAFGDPDPAFSLVYRAQIK